MPDLTALDFALRFTAKLNSGLAAARPANPEDVGDAYFATDTGVLSLANTAGTGWVTYDLSISAATPVSVAKGGTGAVTLTANNLVVGNGTSPVNFIAPGTSGNVLTSNGSVWSSQVPSGGGTSTFHGVYAFDTDGLSHNAGTPIALPFIDELHDTDTYHDLVTNNERLTVPASRDGVYHITGEIVLTEGTPGTQSGVAHVYIEKNGTTVLSTCNLYFDSTLNNSMQFNLSVDADLAVGDYVKLVFQKTSWTSSGTDLDINGWFMMHLIGT